MNRLLKKAGIRHLSPHGLRHTTATLMMAAGENAKVIAEKLGHSTTAFTLDVYAHAGPTLQEEASARVGQRMGWKR
jgi:integrase